MNTWLEIGLSNALAAALLALVVWAVASRVKNPQVAAVLWTLVLARLLFPPLVELPLVSLRELLAAGPTIDSAAATIDESSSVRIEKLAHYHDQRNGPHEPIIDARQNIVNQLATSELEPFDEQAASIASLPAIPQRTSPAPSSARIENRSADFPTAHALRAVDWPRAIASVWIAGTLAWTVLAVLRVRRFRQLLRQATPAPAEVQSQVHQLSTVFQLSRTPRVCMIARPLGPLAWGLFGCPTILLPVELWQALSTQQRQTLLAHELTHLTRRGFAFRWLELAALGAYWWNPVAWWARRSLERAEEQCCDARVVAALPELARAYAETMLIAVDFLSPVSDALPLGARGFSQATQLERRMSMVLSGTVSTRMPRPWRWTLLATAALILPLSLRMLWAVPQIVKPTTSESATTVDQIAPSPASAPQAVSRSSAPVVSAPASDVEQRLERVEKMLEALVTQLQVVSRDAKPNTVDRTAPATNADLRAFVKPKEGQPPQSHRPTAWKVAPNVSWDDATNMLNLAVTRRKAELEVLNREAARGWELRRELASMYGCFDAGTANIADLITSQQRCSESWFALARHSEQRPDQIAYLNSCIANAAQNEAVRLWELAQKFYLPGDHPEGRVTKREFELARDHLFQCRKAAREFETVLENLTPMKAEKTSTPPINAVTENARSSAASNTSPGPSEQPLLTGEFAKATTIDVALRKEMAAVRHEQLTAAREESSARDLNLRMQTEREIFSLDSLMRYEQQIQELQERNLQQNQNIQRNPQQIENIR